MITIRILHDSHFYCADIDKNQPGHSKEPLQNAIKNLLAMNETPKTFEDAQKMFKSDNLKTPETVNKNPAKDATSKPTDIAKTVEIPFCSHKIENKSTNTEEEPGSTSSSVLSRPIRGQYSDHVTCIDQSEAKLELSHEERQAAEEILRELVQIRKEGEHQSDPILDTMIRF